jgi:hypothetical protein
LAKVITVPAGEIASRFHVCRGCELDAFDLPVLGATLNGGTVLRLPDALGGAVGLPLLHDGSGEYK